MLLKENFFEKVIFQTNSHNIQHSTSRYKVPVNKQRPSDISIKHLQEVTVTEMRKIIGIVFYMGIYKLANRRLY